MQFSAGGLCCLGSGFLCRLFLAQQSVFGVFINSILKGIIMKEAISNEVVTLNLNANKAARNLYIEYPFFTDVLRWLGGEIEFNEIPQLDTLENFRAYCLPEIKGGLLRLGLLKAVDGKVVPMTTRVVLQEIPSCPVINRLIFENNLGALRRTANQHCVYTSIETLPKTVNAPEQIQSKFCYVVTLTKNSRESASCSA